MAEDEKDEQPSDPERHGNPRSGIICPWNKDDTGPAKERIHCLVWRNWEDFSGEFASDHSDPVFCTRHCQYGRNPEARRRSVEIRARYSGKMPAWFKAMTQPPDWMFPVRGRKVR